MNLDTQRIDDAVLGLLYLTLHEGVRAWKSMDWGAMERLHQRDLIFDPASKAKSVVLTETGLREAQRLCGHLFGRTTNTATVRVHYGNASAEAERADGISGSLCRDATTGQYFFRVAKQRDEFTDYDLRHDDLAVTIATDAMAAFYRSGEMHVLDHSPDVLGLRSEGSSADVGA